MYSTVFYACECSSRSTPVRADGRIVGQLVVVDATFALQDKPLLDSVRSDAGHTHDRLLEMGVYRRACGGLETFQLTRRGHVETLKRRNLA